jgi:hypothetical protein
MRAGGHDLKVKGFGAMRVVRRFLLLIFFLATISQIFSYLYLQATAPRKPDASLGAIYLRRMQGDTVYLTKAQSYYCNDWIVDIAALCGLPVMLYEAWAQQKRTSERKDEERRA